MLKPYLSIIIFILLSCNDDSIKIKAATYDETALRNFVIASQNYSQPVATASLDSILQNTSSDSAVFHQAISFLEKPFSDANSSFRNEDLYQIILQAKIKSPWYSLYEKQIAKERIDLLQQNKVGNVANDFVYTTPAGYRKKMNDIKTDYTLLYFYNPECEACKQMKEALQSSPVINDKISKKQLTVLAIYTDKDEKLWLNHLAEMHPTWINGRDEDEYLYKNKIYDLRAIPTIYLLGKDKRVLLKDCLSIPQIENKLEN